MEILGWGFSFMFWVIYLVAVFTVALLTFKKGHVLLGILGIFLPILWLIGAILPARPGSRFAIEQSMRQQAAMDQMTQ
jgi:hypothetical protein